MNKILTLSAALLAVSSISFAGNNSVISANGKTVSVPKVQRQQSTVVDNLESQRLALPQVLDSKAPAEGYKEFLMNEARYSRLTREFPDRAETLFEANEENAKARYEHLLKLKALYE